MVHTFRLAGMRFALDEASGFCTAVDEITCKLLAYLVPPIPEVCSSAIRYDMAKYDSRLVDLAYEKLYALYREGRLFSDRPFAPETFPRRGLTLPSSGDAALFSTAEKGFSLVLTDTDNPDAARRLCEQAREAGAARITVSVTQDGSFPADRLLFPEARYAAHRHDAPEVGVCLVCDPAKPSLLADLIRLADDGVTLFDFRLSDPSADPAALNGLCKELGKTAKELFLRAKEGRPVTFLPYERQTGGIQTASGADNAFASARCRTCAHRMVCSGGFVSEADCVLREACADGSLLLSHT